MSAIATQFNEFCRAHPVRTLEHDGVTWRYRVAGTGVQGLLLFPGAVGDGEVYFVIAPRLMRTHRLVAFAYPETDRLDQFIVGVCAVLDREGLTLVDVIGGSFGGLVAQSLLQAAPSLVRRVVLSATGPAKRERSAKNARASHIVGRIPLFITRALLRLIVRLTTKKVTVERAFWRAFYNDAIGRIPKSALQSRYALGTDLDRHGPISREDVAAWTGEMLILEGGSDAIANRAASAALTSIFPRARHHTFAGAGHGIALEHPVEWAEAVVAFLNNGNHEGGRRSLRG
jgi:pimeloyl-ACP methyl ester carboxylesterase